MARCGPSKRVAKTPTLVAAGGNPFEGEYPSSTQSAEEFQGVDFGSFTQNASLAAPEPDDEVAMVRRATEVLGIDHVARWMQREIPSLGNQTPYLLIQTEDGRRQVLRVLLKIEHGVY